MNPPLRIGFIDHDLDNYHANTFARLLREEHPEAVLSAVFSNRHDNRQAWAADHRTVAVDTMEAMRELTDAIMVLAPSHPETHWDLCQAAFALGKPTYVDKTFAPDFATAEAIFAEADRRQVAVQTSSVLRYTEVQAYCRENGALPPRCIDTWMSGGNFDEYIVHPVEHVISLMGPEVTGMTRCRKSGFEVIELTFSGERIATIHFRAVHATPYFTFLSDDKASRPFAIDASRIFSNGLDAIVDFLRCPAHAIDRAETLAIYRILEALKNG